MNLRERYIECLTFGKPDQFIFQHTFGLMPGTLERWHNEGLSREIDIEEDCKDEKIRQYFGFDQRVPELPINFELYPSFEPQVIEETDEYVIRQDKMGTVGKINKGITTLPLPIQFPVKDSDNWKEEYRPRLHYSSNRFGDDWEEHYQRIRNQGLPITVNWKGFYWFPRDLMGDEKLCMAYYLQPDLVHDILDTYAEMLIATSEELLEKAEIDAMHMSEDMCYRNGMMVSPDTFREFMLPHYKRLVSLYQGHGTKVFSVDTDGNLNELIPLLIEAGINVIMPCEVQAGNDIVEMRKKYGKAIAFVGGINKRALADNPHSLIPLSRTGDINTRQAIEEEIAYRLSPMLETGGYIAGLDHRVLPETSLENFTYYVRMVREHLGLDLNIPVPQEYL